MAATIPPPKSRRWWLLAMLLLAVSLAGFAQFMNFSLRGQSTESAADRSVVRSVVCYGFVDVESGVSKLYPLQPSRVAEIAVHEGELVPAGTVLVRLVDDGPRAQAEQARRDLDAAQIDLSEARIKLPEKHRLDLQSQAAAVTQAKHMHRIREIAHQHKKNLADSNAGLSSQSDVNMAKEELDAAKSLVEVEENKLKQLKLQDPQSEIRRQEALVAKLAAASQVAQAALAEHVIKAPRTGSVLRILASPGDAVGPGSPLPAVEFAAEGTRIVRAEVEQAFAANMVAGLPVTIQDGANASAQKWKGKVQRVGDWYTRKRNVISDPNQVNDVRTLECIIQLDDGQPPLKINQQVLVTIQLP
jgi:multidrug resistance efflux pump